ncbi:mediator of RNA polymerase II transcription subunit 6 [Nematocida sp. LUAm3]|nr:mediator of RNA polymerase II transcription subunit 6 [Nematocida sp. LUAm3]KAI5175816.1 mediator of RNA polymerase II transcription subunit 6 [Nematocida sp. LUAm2]KAI5178312.1 mediator of RNA polymerase II transcription subunit 6 [Nematocida sp. LUAm1]
MENTCFRDPIWLMHNPLTSESVLEYFSFSQFYDRNCNNEVLKMQTKHSMLLGSEEFLKRMCGIQYSLHYAEEPYLFILKKRERFSPEKLITLEYYCIIHGTVYQTPTEREVLKTRNTNILFSMMNSLDSLPFFPPSTTTRSISSIETKKKIPSSRVLGMFNAYYTDFLKVDNISQDTK